MSGISKTFRIIASIALLAIVGVSLSGCARKSSSSNTAVDTAGAVTLTIWRAADDSESFQNIIKSYQQEHPNVTIEYKYNPDWKTNPDLYLQESVNALATGKGPDIWSVRNDWIPGQYQKVRPAPDGVFASQSNDQDLKQKSNVDFVKSAFVPVVAQDTIINDQVYGVPLSVDSLALYLNTTILEQVSEEITSKNKVSNDLLPDELSSIKKILTNGPKDWTELVKIAPYITSKQGSSISRSAIALGLGDNIEQAPNIISTLLLQNDTQIVTDDHSGAYFQNSQQTAGGNASYPGQGAIKFYTYFSNPNHPWYSWNEGDFPDGARQAFLDGKLAMILEDSTFYATLKASNIKFGFNIVQMPQINRDTPKSYADYWVETVTNNSKVSDVAWDFLTFAATTSNVSSYLSNTKRPPALLSRAGEYDANATQLSVFNSQALIAESWYKGPDAIATNNIFRNWANNIALNNVDIAEATNIAAGQLTTLLQSGQ